MEIYPTPFQKKTLWSAITVFSLLVVAAFGIFLVFLGSRVLGFLQPVLVPLAVAAILAHLLEPIIHWLVSKKLSRLKAIILLYLLLGGLIVWGALTVLPEIIDQAHGVWNERHRILEKFTIQFKALWQKAETFPAFDQAKEWVLSDSATQWAWEFTSKHLQGAIGVIGYLIGFALVPVYLFFFLKDAAAINESWADYLPFRKSKFKKDLVATLREINTYLIAFFRGQVLVSLIDGVLTGILLKILGLQFAELIGVMLAILGIIPFVGILLASIPALLIAFAQDGGWHFALSQQWMYPLAVAIIFLVVQQIDGLLIQPKIVGDSVGLHPLTIIFSMLFWSLLLGGFLGALLAVPLTAAVKVVFKRYVWEKKILHHETAET